MTIEQQTRAMCLDLASEWAGNPAGQLYLADAFARWVMGEDVNAIIADLEANAVDPDDLDDMGDPVGRC